MRAFRQETGQALGAYMADIAMRRAEARLRENAWPVARISTEAGFRSSSSFAATAVRSNGAPFAVPVIGIGACP